MSQTIGRQTGVASNPTAASQVITVVGFITCMLVLYSLKEWQEWRMVHHHFQKKGITGLTLPLNLVAG